MTAPKPHVRTAVAMTAMFATVLAVTGLVVYTHTPAPAPAANAAVCNVPAVHA